MTPITHHGRRFIIDTSDWPFQSSADHAMGLLVAGVLSLSERDVTALEAVWTSQDAETDSRNLEPSQQPAIVRRIEAIESEAYEAATRDWPKRDRLVGCNCTIMLDHQ